MDVQMPNKDFQNEFAKKSKESEAIIFFILSYYFVRDFEIVIDFLK